MKILNAFDVKNENDLINYLSNSDGEITLKINSEIDITKKININSTIQKLYIIGDSLDSSKINLIHPLYFVSNIEEIKIKNININGNLFFKNNEFITFDTVNLNGYIDSDFDENSNNYIEIARLTYKPVKELVENCINLSGNIKINSSYFYGNSSCRNRLLHYNGFKKYNLNIKKFYFIEYYECPFLSIKNVLNANIEASCFEKGYSTRNSDEGT